MTNLNFSLNLHQQEQRKTSPANLTTTIYNDNQPIPRFKPFHQLIDNRPIRATCFHPSGETYVVGTNSRVLTICHYPSSDLIEDQNGTYCNYGNGTGDSSTFAESSTNETVLMPPYKPKLAFEFIRIHLGSVYCCNFNQSGDLLATGSNDQTVNIIKYDAKLHEPHGSEYRLPMHPGTVRDVCFTRGERSHYLLSAGAGDFDIYVSDTNTMKPIQAFKGHEATVMSLHNWDSPTHFFSGSQDGTIRLWDLRLKNCVATIRRPYVNPSYCDQPVDWTPSKAFANDRLSDGRSSNGTLNPNSSRDGGNLTTTHSNDSHNTSDLMHKTELAVAHQQQQQQIQLSNKQPQQQQPPRDSVGVVRVDPTGRLLVSGHRDGSCMLHDIRGKQTIQIFQAHEGEIRTLNFGPKCYYLLTASYDGQVKLMDIQGDLSRPLPNVTLAQLNDKVIQTAWHPKEYNFVTTCADGTATLWTKSTT